MNDNILKRISNKLMKWLDWLADKYGIFGVAAFLIISIAVALLALGMIALSIGMLRGTVFISGEGI